MCIRDRDTEIQTGTLAKKYNARKAMIVYGGGSIIRSGLLQRIEAVSYTHLDVYKRQQYVSGKLLCVIGRNEGSRHY